MTDTKPRLVAEFRCGEDDGSCGRLVGTVTRERFGGEVVLTTKGGNLGKDAWEINHSARCPKHLWVTLLDYNTAALVEARARRQTGKPRIYLFERGAVLDGHPDNPDYEPTG